MNIKETLVDVISQLNFNYQDTKHVHTIGRTDKADFPELSLRNIDIKIDSGAYTSSIHSHQISEIDIDGEKVLEFEVLDPSHEQYKSQKLTTKNYRIKPVKSSNGETEQRFFVTTKIILFNTEHTIQLSLANRGGMKYPVLIGRRFLKHKFVIDTAQKNCSFDQKENP